MEDTALERKGRRRCCSLSFVFHSSLTYAGLQNCALEIHARQQRFHVCNVHTCNTSGGGTKPRCLQQSRFTPPQNTHIHTYTDTHTCTHTHTHTHAYTRTHTHAYTRIHTHLCLALLRQRALQHQQRGRQHPNCSRQQQRDDRRQRRTQLSPQAAHGPQRGVSPCKQAQTSQYTPQQVKRDEIR